jgi:hypothetical protein
VLIVDKIEAEISARVRQYDRASARSRSNDLRLKAADLLAQAACLPHISKLERQQLRCAYAIAMLKLHQVVGEPDADDADAVINNLMDLAKSVDNLVEAIGDEAKSGLGIENEPQHWRNQLYGALVGNATCELDTIARRLENQK